MALEACRLLVMLVGAGTGGVPKIEAVLGDRQLGVICRLVGPRTGVAVEKVTCGDWVGGVPHVVGVMRVEGFQAVGLLEGEASSSAHPLVHPRDDRQVLRSASHTECAPAQLVSCDPE